MFIGEGAVNMDMYNFFVSIYKQDLRRNKNGSLQWNGKAYDNDKTATIFIKYFSQLKDAIKSPTEINIAEISKVGKDFT